MRFNRPETNELIIGMSLAELFLFMMLITWWSSAVPKDAAGVPPTIEIANLRSQVQQLQEDNDKLRADTKTLHTQVEALLIALNLPPDTPLTPEGIKKAAQSVRRGAPVCDEASNILADITLLGGQLSIALRGRLDMLDGGKSEWASSQVLTSRPDIDRFLGTVLRFNSNHICRFEYSLRYRTADDYHQVRTTFENLLYPGPITRER